MRDASTGEYRPDAARLARGDAEDEATADPQARDEQHFLIDSEEFTEEPAAADIEDWVEEYDNNPFIRVPTRLYVSDVVEPGYDVDVAPADPSTDPEDYTEPTVPDAYPNATYRGLDLSDALVRWLSRSVIVGNSFDRDFRALLEHALTDAVGRRGTALVEHVYDDPSERRRLLGLRAFKVNDVTAYTRKGKAILLRPDDPTEADIEAARAPTLGVGDDDRPEAPKTPAGKTAAFVQFDDIYGADEREEIAFALDDVTMLANDPDTGEIFGRPESASVAARSKAFREQLQDVDQGLKNAAWNNLIANVNTDDKDEAKKMLSGLNPNSPDSVSVTNTSPEITELSGEVPAVTDHFKQQIEFIVAGLPVPLYRVGFEGDINRDVTGEQSDDYQDQLARTRRLLEAAFRTMLELKACEFLTGHAHPDDADESALYGSPADVPDVSLHVRPDGDSNPFQSNQFDAQAFQQLMQGLKAAASGGQVSTLVRAEAILDLIPGLDPEEAMPDVAQDAAEMDLGPLDESDPAVREAFAEYTDTAALATRYDTGDVVDTPDGVGVVTEVLTESWENEGGADGAPDSIEASSDSPTYAVVIEDASKAVGFYTASDLEASEIDTDVDPLGSLSDDEEAMACCSSGSEEATLAWSPPKSWREAETPARLIAMDAFSSMGGEHGGDDGQGCAGTMSGTVGDADRFCAAFLDYIYGGYDYWRGDSFLPGD